MAENGHETPAASGSGSGDVVYTTVESLRPLMEGVNLVCKCIEVNVVVNRRRPDGTYNKIVEAKVGDETGHILLSLRNEQADNVENGTFLTIVNGKVDMFKATMRLAVDAKWGKVEVAGANDKKPSWDVNMDYNLSAVEYELVMEKDDRGSNSRNSNRNKPSKLTNGPADQDSGAEAVQAE